MAGAAFGRAALFAVQAGIGLAVAAAASAIVLWAASVAALLPFALQRLPIDQAVVSTTLITTLVDDTELFLYLQIARLLLAA